jgi:hypothetical protein
LKAPGIAALNWPFGLDCTTLQVNVTPVAAHKVSATDGPKAHFWLPFFNVAPDLPSAV